MCSALYYSDLYGDIELEENLQVDLRRAILKPPISTRRLSLPVECHSITKQYFLQHQKHFN